MKIVNVVISKGYTGFYFDDQQAIKKGAEQDGFTYKGDPMTLGFTKIRQPGESISIQLLLADGSVAVGDCAAVQYSGCGGRDPLFLADDFIECFNKHLIPRLIGLDVSHFRDLAEHFDTLKIEGKQLHTAIRYGITQALLSATAISRRTTRAEVIRREYEVKSKTYKDVAIFTQSGDERYLNVDKMIIKEADVLPHGLINNVETKLGKQGEKLEEYVAWLRERTLKLRSRDTYYPIFHLDLYGTLGMAFNNDIERIVQYCIKLEGIAQPFGLRIEGPVDTNDREGTMLALKAITKRLIEENSKVEIVADEWCNTLEDIKYFADHKAGHMVQIKTPDLGGINNVAEAIIYCKQKNVGAYCGGTCNETDITAQITTEIAMACEADQCLAKPGMGTDEGYMIVKNHMNRVKALANNRHLFKS